MFAKFESYLTIEYCVYEVTLMPNNFQINTIADSGEDHTSRLGFHIIPCTILLKHNFQKN